MWCAAVECDPAAEQAALPPAAPVVKAAVLIERRHGEDLLQLGRRSARIVAQPMPRSSRQHDKVAGGERSLICLGVDLEPAAARRHDMECRIAVRLDAKPPR